MFNIIAPDKEFFASHERIFYLSDYLLTNQLINPKFQHYGNKIFDLYFKRF
jgi:hypothetical protein